MSSNTSPPIASKSLHFAIWFIQRLTNRVAADDNTVVVDDNGQPLNATTLENNADGKTIYDRDGNITVCDNRNGIFSLYTNV